MLDKMITIQNLDNSKFYSRATVAISGNGTEWAYFGTEYATYPQSIVIV